MPRPWDDDELLVRLAEAQRAAERVPRDFIEAGKAAFAWRNIDAELAELACGLAAEEASLAGQARADEAHLRALTFTSTALTIEIEVTGEALLGRVIPLQAGEVEVTTQAGRAQRERIDDGGRFTIRPIPDGSFRIHCRTAAGASVSTNWLSL